VRNELSRSLPFLALFAVGLAVGIWTFLSPWALSYPMTTGWTTSVWTSVWVGGILTAASAISLVAVLARAMYVVLAEARNEA
jgi:hypothetical protein